MKAKQITYERLVNIGNYQHEKFGIVLEVQDDEKAEDVLKKAKEFVDRQIHRPTSGSFAIAEQVSKFIEDGNDIPF